MLTVSTATLDTFEDGTTLNWSEGVTSPNPPEWVETGGPNGDGDGFLRNISTGSGPGSRMVLFHESDQWIGNYLAEGVTSIQAQVANFGDAPLPLRIALATGAGSGSRRSTWFSATDAIVIPADGQWREVTFELDAERLTSVQGTQSLSEVLSDVTEFRILASANPDFRGDVLSGSLGLDSIQASGVENPWHNVAIAEDVNGDGSVTPIDALQIINELTARLISDPTTGVLPDSNSTSPPYYDVDNNGLVTPIDALRVINVISRNSNRPPTAIEDVGFTVAVGDTLTIDPQTLLANDFDSDDDPLSLQSVENSNLGAAVAIINNQISYNPRVSPELSSLSPTEERTDSFSYTVADDNGVTATGQVTVRVIGQEVVRFRFEAVDTAGNPIEFVETGAEFGLAVYVEDVRSSPTGVFSPYLDIEFESNLATPTGVFEFAPDVTFPDTEPGKFATAGLIDEAGAFLSFPAVDSGEVLVFTIPFTASQTTGALTFAGNPADVAELHDLTFSGSGDIVPASQVDFGRETLRVVDAALATFAEVHTDSLAATFSEETG